MSPGWIIEYWPNTSLVKVWIMVENESYKPEGWDFIPLKDGPPPTPVDAPLTPEEEAAIQSNKLSDLISEADVQKATLTNRISTLQDAIDLEMATQAEVSEKAVKETSLLEWKKYAVLLGRVSTQAKWPKDPKWPTKPAS